MTHDLFTDILVCCQIGRKSDLMIRDDLSRGTNQIGVRLYNERLILSLIRRHGALPKADIARLTGLSAQTVSVIMRQLDADALVLPQKRVRGKIGQPSVPFSLNQNGSFSIGVKVGRRDIDLVVMDFVGSILETRRKTYTYPRPSEILAFIETELEALRSQLPQTVLARMSGVGIAIPFELWNWAEEVGVSASVLDDWRTCDLQAEVAKLCPWPIYRCNDATAACAAELVFGNGADHDDHLYFFVGYFIGGGLVMNGNLVTGKRGNAAALGPMPIPSSDGVTSRQLIQCASIYLLEQSLADAGQDPLQLWQSPQVWLDLGATLDDWLEETAQGIAYATITASAVLDFDAAIIDGDFPPEIRTRLVAGIIRHLDRIDKRGLLEVTILEGSIGSASGAIGGASLPLLAEFARDREVLFKD